MTRRPAAGFTLLEVLVALAVLGLLLGLLADGVHLGLKAWDAQARTLRAHDELDAVDRTLRNLVEQMDPGSVTAAPGVLGNRDRLLFTSDLPDGAAQGPAERADIALAVDARHRLVLRWTPHVHAIGFGPVPSPQEVVLLSGVARVELAYWPRVPPWQWRTAWAEHVLPGLVRIRVVFRDGDARHWPDIVAAPLRAPRPG